MHNSKKSYSTISPAVLFWMVTITILVDAITSMLQMLSIQSVWVDYSYGCSWYTTKVGKQVPGKSCYKLLSYKICTQWAYYTWITSQTFKHSKHKAKQSTTGWRPQRMNNLTIFQRHHQCIIFSHLILLKVSLRDVSSYQNQVEWISRYWNDNTLSQALWIT